VTEREPSHADLVKQAAEAMRANGRIPEMPVLRSLPAEALRLTHDASVNGEHRYRVTLRTPLSVRSDGG
jgi:hypothetical protein